MKFEDVVYEIVNAFLEHYAIFPMRRCFYGLAETLISVSGDTLARLKDSARDSVSSLPPNFSNKFSTGKAPSRSMQTTRTAVNVFNVLDKSALKLGVSSSADITGEFRARGRALVYDTNAKSLRYLHGSLPLWIKSFPTSLIVYARCAVKMAQKKYVMATATLEGDDVLEVFTEYLKGETVHELETLCDKLQSYLTTLKGFVEMNCCIPDMDRTETEMRDRKLFLDAMRHCKSLLLLFNEFVPILQGIDNGSRKRLEDAWKSESEDTEGNVSELMKDNHYAKGMLFHEKRKDFSAFLEDIQFLHEVATGKGELLNRVGSIQISNIAFSQHIRSSIAQSGMQNLRNIGYNELRNERKKRKKKETRAPSSQDELSSKFIRNNDLQIDIFCLWNAVISGDASVGNQLLTPDRRSSRDATSIRIHLPDEWYESFFSSILVPSIMECAVNERQKCAVVCASSSVLRRFVEK